MAAAPASAPASATGKYYMNEDGAVWKKKENGTYVKAANGTPGVPENPRNINAELSGTGSLYYENSSGKIWAKELGSKIYTNVSTGRTDVQPENPREIRNTRTERIQLQTAKQVANAAKNANNNDAEYNRTHPKKRRATRSRKSRRNRSRKVRK